jgi:Flp pilus assembly protein TadD
MPARLRTLGLSALLAALSTLATLATGCVDTSTEHRVRANAFLRGGDAEGAVKECDEGLTKRPDDAGLHILRGKALFELTRYDDAKMAYEKAISVGKETEDATLAEAHLGLAMIGSRQGDWAGARGHFEKLVVINDKDTTSRMNLAKACLSLGDLKCAVEQAELAGQQRGNDEAVLFALGTVYLRADKPKEAELTFGHICEVVPNAATCPYGLALVAAKAGERDKALAEVGRAVDRKLPNPEQLASDPGFVSLASDPAFLALVERAKK